MIMIESGPIAGVQISNYQCPLMIIFRGLFLNLCSKERDYLINLREITEISIRNRNRISLSLSLSSLIPKNLNVPLSLLVDPKHRQRTQPIRNMNRFQMEPQPLTVYSNTKHKQSRTQSIHYSDSSESSTNQIHPKPLRRYFRSPFSLCCCSGSFRLSLSLSLSVDLQFMLFLISQSLSTNQRTYPRLKALPATTNHDFCRRHESSMRNVPYSEQESPSIKWHSMQCPDPWTAVRVNIHIFVIIEDQSTLILTTNRQHHSIGIIERHHFTIPILRDHSSTISTQHHDHIVCTFPLSPYHCISKIP